ALLENFDFSAQDNGQSHIALPCLENQFGTLEDFSFCQRSKKRKLVIVQLRKGDTFRIAVELFVLSLFVGCHFPTLRTGTPDQTRDSGSQERFGNIGIRLAEESTSSSGFLGKPKKDRSRSFSSNFICILIRDQRRLSACVLEQYRLILLEKFLADQINH